MSTANEIFEKAKTIIKEKDGVSKLISQSGSKLKSFAKDSDIWKELQSKLEVLIKMMKCHVSGEYKAFSNSSILLIVFALAYFVTPTDVIPDFVPALGFTDDASVIFLIYRKLNKDIEHFLEWSGSKKSAS